MGIIKAEDFEKINQNKLTIEELRQQEKHTQHYTAGQTDIRQKMAEAEQSVSQSLSEEITLLDDRLQLSQKSFKLAEQEIVRLKKVISDNAEVQELKNNLVENQAYLEKLEAQCNDLAQQLATESEAKLSLINDQAELTTNYAVLQKQVQAQAQELELKTEKINVSENQLSSMTQQLATAKQEAELTAATLERENLAYAKVLEDLVDLKTAAGIAATKMTASQTELLRYETELTELRATLQKETLRNEQLLAEKAQAQYLFEKQKRLGMELQLQLKRSKDTESGVGKSIQALNAKIIDLESAKEKAVGEMNRVIGALRIEQEKNLKSESDFQRAALEFKSLRAELEQTKDALELFNPQRKMPESDLQQSFSQIIEIPVQA